LSVSQSRSASSLTKRHPRAHALAHVEVRVEADAAHRAAGVARQGRDRRQREVVTAADADREEAEPVQLGDGALDAGVRLLERLRVAGARRLDVAGVEHARGELPSVAAVPGCPEGGERVPERSRAQRGAGPPAVELDPRVVREADEADGAAVGDVGLHARR